MARARVNQAYFVGCLLMALPCMLSAQNYVSITDERTGVTQIATEEEGYRITGGGYNKGIGFKVFHVGEFPPATPVLSYSWYISIVAPAGEELRPGLYVDASCHAPKYGRSISVEMTEDNPICRNDTVNSIFGWVAIRQFELGPDGSATKLEVVFNQRLGSPEGKGHLVVIRKNAYPMYFRIASDAGAKAARFNREYHGDTSFFELAGSANDVVSFAASVPQDHWLSLVTPPTGKTLQVGTYRVARTADTTRVGLSLQRQFEEHLTCSDFQGTLQVKQIASAPTQEISGLWAQYEVGCGRKATMKGELRYGL